ncbi:MAG: hypothetical protein KBF66_16565, partial [Rhodoferax sp.]|uniref:hypothetical protein n=1 Tax=Rhodoferax sp. TaxID=50421 RepID=UPI001B43F31D
KQVGSTAVALGLTHELARQCMTMLSQESCQRQCSHFACGLLADPWQARPQTVTATEVQPADRAQSDKIFAITYQFDSHQHRADEQKFAEPHFRFASHSAGHRQRL